MTINELIDELTRLRDAHCGIGDRSVQILAFEDEDSGNPDPIQEDCSISEIHVSVSRDFVLIEPDLKLTYIP